MHGGAGRARGVRSRDEVVPLRQPAAEVALRELEQHGRRGLCQLLDVLGSREPVPMT